MPIEAFLNFNGNNAYEGLSKAFEDVIKQLCDTVLANAESMLGGDYPEVVSSLHVSLLSLATSGLIEGQIGASHWMAFLAEWGSGSEIDTSNPDLQGYMESELWNPLRGSKTIVGRPPGQYMGLDGQLHMSSGKIAGRYIEHFVPPKPALHFMRDALESNRNLILDQLNGVIETFSFGDFFV